MRPIPELRGLKFPDDYVVRHFFKRGLQTRPGRVLELGCGVGNNLSLYRAYGWQVTGIDYDAAALDDARWNLEDEATLAQADLSQGLPPLTGTFDTLIIPNMLCYLRTEAAFALMEAVADVMAPDADIFIRTRLMDDHRYGRGREVEPHGFILDTPETGEAGLFNSFFSEAGLVEFLSMSLGLGEHETLTVRFDNVQAGTKVRNSDVVVWGKLVRDGAGR